MECFPSAECHCTSIESVRVQMKSKWGIPMIPLHLTSLHADEGKHNLTFFHASVHVVIRWILVCKCWMSWLYACHSEWRNPNKNLMQTVFITFAQVAKNQESYKFHFHAPQEMGDDQIKWNFLSAMTSIRDLHFECSTSCLSRTWSYVRVKSNGKI